MAELAPYPFAALVRRMFRELERSRSIFDLPAARFHRGEPGIDSSVELHGRRVATPLGPAAGPQTQMAQNIALSWLGGCRVMELKTVQIDDRLDIPRPCIDVHTVGLNAEWSQELALGESLDEYVKGAMLVEMLRSGALGEAAAPRPGFDGVLYDMSLGYDLAGIRSERVQGFVRGMLDASAAVERLRAEIPAEHAVLRQLDFPTRLSDSVTLSTFHGCPPDEIERIIDFLLRELALHSVVKFNPMLLGPEETGHLLHDVLGYTDMEVPASAFERDTRWEQAVELVERLGETAAGLGLGFGAKFSNTLIVRNTRGFLAPEPPEVYLSGEPLHVLAMQLVRRFRRRFGDRYPVSFAAGIDRLNFPDAVALGLVPITVCTDLLRKGGYGRLAGYHGELARRMRAVSATTVDDFVLKAYGLAEGALDALALAADDPRAAACRQALRGGGDLAAAAGEALYARWVAETKLRNTERYADRVMEDERYTRAATDRPPRKIGSHLELFDCITCDICVPVCPNDANFTLHSPQRVIPVAKVEHRKGRWRWRQEPPIELAERHQIANFADFCNDCGNCDIFCPEDGGPYVMKPRFFGSEAAWRGAASLDGFFVERRAGGDRVLGRFAGAEFGLEVAAGQVSYSGAGFRVEFSEDDPMGSFDGDADREVDLTYCHLMDYLRRALLDGGGVNYVNSLTAGAEE